VQRGRTRKKTAWRMWRSSWSRCVGAAAAVAQGVLSRISISFTHWSSRASPSPITSPLLYVHGHHLAAHHQAGGAQREGHTQGQE